MDFLTSIDFYRFELLDVLSPFVNVLSFFVSFSKETDAYFIILKSFLSREYFCDKSEKQTKANKKIVA